jgi:hypothetical protein
MPLSFIARVSDHDIVGFPEKSPDRSRPMTVTHDDTSFVVTSDDTLADLEFKCCSLEHFRLRSSLHSEALVTQVVDAPPDLLPST